MRIPTRPLVTGGALAAVLLFAACGGGHDRDTAASGAADGEVLLQPLSDRGPDPFTESTATTGGTPPPVTRTPQPTATGDQGLRSFSGAAPGLYGGTRNTGSCDVERQVGALAADPARTRAFALSSGIAPESVPGYLRGLTSVVLRADTRVTDHGFRDGQATGFPAVLQAGTAVLVDDRGVPRVRCACGNPLGRPVATDAAPATRGRPWSGYRPARVVVVTPAPIVITHLTIIDVTADSWIERPVGQDGHRHDRPVPRPGGTTPPGRPDTSPSPHDSASGTAPRDEDGVSPSPDGSAEDCVTPDAPRTEPPRTEPPETAETTPEESAGSGTGPSATPTDDSVMGVSRHGRPSAPGEPADCATATRSAPPPTRPGPTPAPSRSDGGVPRPSGTATPDRPATRTPSAPPTGPGTPSEDTAPDLPDAPGDGGLLPDDPDPGESVFDVSTGVFDG
ncbi:DUF6777 domain-containing protein [Streptomyces sp. NPDC001910]|uniref:DUF6777 domain-containing protein n=1 Tax=Streptomyces sp. NPDC001910 TaxID=3154403 RepID=UPI00331FF4F8